MKTKINIKNNNYKIFFNIILIKKTPLYSTMATKKSDEKMVLKITNITTITLELLKILETENEMDKTILGYE